MKASSSRLLSASQIHAMASLPASVRLTINNLRSMGYNLAQAYKLAVSARQA